MVAEWLRRSSATWEIAGKIPGGAILQKKADFFMILEVYFNETTLGFQKSEKGMKL